MEKLRPSVTAFESFISNMYERCDLLIRNWLRNREDWTNLTGRVALRVVKAVSGLFLKPVWPDLTLRQIAQLAQVTEGVILRLFGSRAGLYACVRLYTMDRVTIITRCFLAQHGASGLTIADVAGAVGMPEDEILQLFPSMEHLLKYVLAAR